MVKAFNEMDRNLMKIAIWIVNNLQDTAEEVERITEVLQKVCEDEYDFDMQFAIYNENIHVKYIDCNKEIQSESWIQFKTLIPNYICFDDWCTIFVKEYMKRI